jgi:azurin
MRNHALVLALCAAALLASPTARAANCSIDLVSDDLMKFDKTSVTVDASCPEITVNLAHSGQLPAAAMGHNVAIAATDVWQAAAQDGIKGGLEGGYVMAGDARIIAHTAIIGGGQTTSVSFPGSALTAGTAYTFFCSFPGHWTVMKGELVVR